MRTALVVLFVIETLTSSASRPAAFSILADQSDSVTTVMFVLPQMLFAVGDPAFAAVARKAVANRILSILHS